MTSQGQFDWPFSMRMDRRASLFHLIQETKQMANMYFVHLFYIPAAAVVSVQLDSVYAPVLNPAFILQDLLPQPSTVLLIVSCEIRSPLRLGCALPQQQLPTPQQPIAPAVQPVQPRSKRAGGKRFRDVPIVPSEFTPEMASDVCLLLNGC